MAKKTLSIGSVFISAISGKFPPLCLAALRELIPVDKVLGGF